MRRVILASSSPFVKDAFQKLNVPFEVQNADFHENLSQELSTEEFVRAICDGIIKIISGKNHDSIVVVVESIIYFEGNKLIKPKTKEELKEIILRMRGKKHAVITGYMVVDNISQQFIFRVEETRACFRNLSEYQINNYINSIKTKDNDEAIDRNYFNALGISLSSLSESLGEFNIDSFSVKESKHIPTAFVKNVISEKNVKEDNFNTLKYDDIYDNQKSSDNNQKLYDNLPTKENQNKDEISENENIYKDTKYLNENEEKKLEENYYFNEHTSDKASDEESDEDFSKAFSRNIEKDYKDQKDNKRLKRISSLNPFRKLQRERNPAKIEHERNLRRSIKKDNQIRIKNEVSKSVSNEKDKETKNNNEVKTKEHEAKKKKSDKKKDSDSAFLRIFWIFGYLFEGIKWLFGQDIIARFIIALIAGIVLFGIIFNWIIVQPTY